MLRWTRAVRVSENRHLRKLYIAGVSPFFTEDERE
jgi:hypothetical protein